MRSRVGQSELEVKGKGVSVGVAQQIFPVLTCDPFLGIGCKGPWVIMCKPPISITSDYRIYEGRELRNEVQHHLTFADPDHVILTQFADSGGHG